MRNTVCSMAAAVGLLFCGAGASAHHSTAMFDSDNPVELAGTVVEWQFQNPHVFIMLEVEDEEGEAIVWALEGGNVNGLVRNGWTAMTLQPGDQIVATVRPLRSGAPGGNYGNLRWADGTPVDPRAGRPD
jgi:hypothetical protein